MNGFPTGDGNGHTLKRILTRTNLNASMVTNFFRIPIPFEEFDIQRLAYTEAKLKALRAEHNHEASLFRNGEFIYASPKKGAALNLAKPVRLAVKDHHEVIESHHGQRRAEVPRGHLREEDCPPPLFSCPSSPEHGESIMDAGEDGELDFDVEVKDAPW